MHVTYTQAVELLQKSKKKFEFPVCSNCLSFWKREDVDVGLSRGLSWKSFYGYEDAKN